MTRKADSSPDSRPLTADDLLDLFAPLGASPAELRELLAPFDATKDTDALKAELELLAAEEARIDALPADAVARELRDQGIDLAALRHRLAALTSPAPSVRRHESLGRGLDHLWVGLQRSLAATRAGLETLERAYTPAVLDAHSDPGLAAIIERLDEPVVPLYIGGGKGPVFLAFFWRTQPPPTPPTLQVALGGVAVTPTAVWDEWPTEPGGTAGLRLEGLALAPEAFETSAPLIACSWRAEDNGLCLDLLPSLGESDGH